MSKDYIQLIQEAESYFDTGDIQHGIALLIQASELAGEAGEPVEQSAILNSLALAQEHSGQVAVARETLLRSFKLLRHANALTEAKVLNNLGLIEGNLGNSEAAKQYYQSSLELVTEVDDRVQMAWSLNNLGIVCKDQGQLTEARAYSEQALALLENEDAPQAQAHVLSGLGLTLELLHDVEGAQEYYQRALELYRQVDDQENEAVILHNLGQLYDNQNNFSDALEYYFKSLAINLKNQYKLGVTDNLNSLAALISTAYQVIESLEKQLDNPLRDFPLKFGHIISAWLQVLEDVLGESNSLNRSGDFSLVAALTEAESLESAIKMHKQILRFNQKIGYPVGQIKTLIDLGLLVRDAQQLDVAEQYLTQALTLAEEVANPNDLYNVYFNRGDIRMMAGRVSEAINDYAAAVDAAESIRTRLLLEEEALDYFAWPNLAAYDRLVRIQARLERTKQALSWAERAKSREFLRRLRLSDITRPQQVPQTLIEQEMQLIIQLRQTAIDLQAANEVDRLNILRNYESLEKKLCELWNKMEQFAPEYVALRQGKPTSWEELQQCLQV